MSLLNVKSKTSVSILIAIFSLPIDAFQRSYTKELNENVSFVTIAHRGASGYLPEHTLDAATLAFMQGAHYLEQDIVSTADNVLIVLHDIHIDTVTNVESIFPDRHRDDGRYYAIDFTWPEIQRLHVHEREDVFGIQVYPERYTGQEAFKVASFEQHIKHVKNLNKIFDKEVGYYPEIKAPEWHFSEGKDITKMVVHLLEKHGLTNPDSNIFIQSFNPGTLKRLKNEFNLNVKLVQLIGENSWNESSTDYEFMRSKKGLEIVANYASGIGPWLPQIYNSESKTGTELLQNAQALGLTVHPYTFRADDLAFDMSAEALVELLHDKLKVDGIFTDHTDTVIKIVDRISVSK